MIVSADARMYEVKRNRPTSRGNERVLVGQAGGGLSGHTLPRNAQHRSGRPATCARMAARRPPAGDRGVAARMDHEGLSACPVMRGPSGGLLLELLRHEGSVQ